jgi:hypothetical protein
MTKRETSGRRRTPAEAEAPALAPAEAEAPAAAEAPDEAPDEAATSPLASLKPLSMSTEEDSDFVARGPLDIAEPEAFEVASTPRRAVAWLVDTFLLITAATAIASVMGALHPITQAITRSDGTVANVTTYYPDTIWLYALMADVSVLAIVMWRMVSATPGQLLLGLRVFSAQGPRRLTWLMGARRWLGLYGWIFVGIASVAVPAIWFLTLTWMGGLLLSATSSFRKQAVHDRMADSVVVSTRRSKACAWAANQ